MLAQLMPTSPLAVIGWLVVLALLLYLARQPAHQALQAFSRSVRNAMRLSAKSVHRLQERVTVRNREVLLAQGREAAERMIEREFERIEDSVTNDLSECPALQRRLQEQVAAMEKDYKESIEVPPEPPGWTKAVDAVAKIPSKGDPMVANVLTDIQGSLEKASESAAGDYRKAVQDRHEKLNRMMPRWRLVQGAVRKMDKNVRSLLDRAKTIDRYMDDYQQIVQGSDRALRMLSSSAITEFLVAALVLAIALGGAMINFHLIARPMQEMVGGNAVLQGGFKVANVAALVIIFVEIALGIYMMEALRITRLFPIIGALNDKLRVRMIWITFGFLLSLASIEAGLAYMRELLALDDAALVQSLLSNQQSAVSSQGQWITTAAQMGMGFILPFALTFVAIPLETFFHAGRSVAGVITVGALRAAEWALRLVGNLGWSLGRTLIHFYDLLIFAPLWIERQIKGRKTARADHHDASTGSNLQRGAGA